MIFKNIFVNKRSILCKPKKDELLYFLHIPKTAGTTFTAILDCQFDNKQIYPHLVWSHALNSKNSDFSQYKFIRGHFGYGLHKILNKKLIYICILRNPTDRIISHYDHMKHLPIDTHWVKDNFISKNETILEVLRDPTRQPIFMNEQTRELGLDLNLTNQENLLKILKKGNNYLEVTSSLKLDYGKLLKDAKMHLAQFSYFGIMERFEDSLFLLYYTFGWKPMKINYKLQATRVTKENQLSDEINEEIKSCIEYDLKLYDFAKTLFELRFNQMVKDLKSKYYEEKFAQLPFRKMMYELLEKHYDFCVGGSKPLQNHFINFDFNQKLSGSGWYWRETLFDGTVFRWMGPELESSIDFVLCKKKDMKIQFRVIYEIIPDNLQHLLVNGTEIKLRSEKIGNGIPTSIEQLIEIHKNGTNKGENGVVYEGVISKEALDGKTNYARLIFKMKERSPLPGRFVTGIIDKITISRI